MKWWLWCLGLGIILGFTLVHSTKAANGPYGRDYFFTYYTNQPIAGLDWAFVPYAPANYDGLGPNCDVKCTLNLQSFEAVYKARLFDATSMVDQGRAAAEINMMLGQSGPSFNGSIQAGITYAQDNFQNWENMIATYDSGTVPGYSVQWNVDQDFTNDPIDGLGVDAISDVNNNADLTDCTTGEGCVGDMAFQNNLVDTNFDWAVIFNVNGKQFIIKHKCANITGNIYSLVIPVVSKPYALKPSVNASVSTGATIAEPGDTISFDYNIANSGNGSSDPATCTLYKKSFAGYHSTPGGSPYDTRGTQSTPCSKQVFAANASVQLGATEKYVVQPGDVNSTICRTLSVNPATGPPPTGVNTDESCVIVASLPYTRVFGGDISAGNAQPSAACSPTINDYTKASIVSWNQNNGLYNGGGAQYAAFALGQIDDFSTAQTNNAGSTGQAPSALPFANTTQMGGFDYGGNVGATGIPCMPDYYVVPASAQPVTSSNCYNAGTNRLDLSCLPSGAYSYSGASTLLLSGVLSAGVSGTRVQLFTTSNVYIDNDITFGSGWRSLASIPMFELVTKGANIYVSNKVGELDGTYIAQNTQGDGKGTGGQIATCATATGPFPLDNNLFTNCNKQLIVNGSFVANDVALERTAGTLSQSNSDCPCGLRSSAAEQFNYNPSLWMVQPALPAGATTYNDVVDLPPVL